MDRRTVFSGRLLPVALLLPQLLLTLFFFHWPAGEAVWSSLTAQDAFGQGFVYVGLDNFQDLFSDPRNCPGSSAKSGLWPRQRPESQFFQRKFAYRPPLRGGTWAPSRGTWAVTGFLMG